MNSRLALSLFLFLLAPLARADNEVGFIEKFALAQDREAALSQLIPGSEEFYFFHALHFQNTAQKEKLKTTMAQWAARFPKSPQRQIIENREALLAYDADPQATLRFLRDRLNLEFNHEQQARDAKPDLPAKLDPAEISREAFLRDALRDSEDLSKLEDTALEALVRDRTPISPAQRRALLNRLARPDVAGLVEMIEADLATKESRGFGEFAIHKALLPEQLDELAKRRPALLDSQAFVFARLRKMAPGADADAEFDPAEREAWLERVWAYAKNLSPSFNTLKAHILWLRLQHDRARGLYDKARFVEYLKLPRRTGYIRTEYLNRPELARQPAVDFGADLSEPLVAAPPIGNDEWLVREFLLVLLKDEPAWEPWAVYLREKYVKALFAESKIVHGIGNPEQWAALLSPSQFQALKERVDIDFATTNPRFHAPGAEVKLGLFVKNAPKLIVKIYEINTLSFFLTQNSQLNTDLPLGGLVANSERTLDFSGEEGGRNPFRRSARELDLPELADKRGAWVIELIGSGKSSRALIRKGQWHLLQQTGPAGEMLTVVDEARQPVAGAVAWVEGRKFAPDEKSGRIIVPFTNAPGNKPIILADAAGEFATLTSFEHHAEEYRLDAQFHLEREQLLARREATLAVRAALLLGDAQVAPSLIQDAKLAITSTTLDGISTTTEIKEVKLDPVRAFTHTFLVPERLAQLSVTLSGKVDKLSAGGQKQDLSASDSWPLNGIDKTDAVSDGHLSRMGDGYVFELLGKNGEALPDQQVVFEFTHREFHNQIGVPLRTDERGRIDLGMLAGIEVVQAGAPNGRVRSWPIEGDGAIRPGVIHAKAGEAIVLPWFGGAGPVRRESVSLIERRGESFAADHFATISVANGFLVIKGLPPGDYSLRLREEAHDVEIRVTAGERVQSWLLSPTRHLELRDLAPLQIESARAEADALVIQLRNVNRFTRLHVAATRFHPDATMLDTLGDFERFEPALAEPARRPNLFVAGRAIGDEHRYILERRYAKLFPGNMLPRPGLLLNPWEVRSTDVAAQAMSRGDAPARAAGDREARQRAAKPAAPGEMKAVMETGPETEGTNLDFLASAAPVLLNVTPDANGVVRIDRKQLGDRQHVQIYAEDLTSAVFRSFALPEVPTKFQDLRLTRNLDPEKHFTERKQVTVLTAGQTLTLPDILTSELETYDTLASVHALFTTLSGDARLAEFAWVLQWPKLKDEEKRAKYSEFACHELSFFLSRKDPQFFQQVIVPYLRNKKDKTFIDEYLLGADLRRFLEPWQFARLNMAERALLGQRIAGESAASARHLRELWELLPPDPARLDHLFETALRGRAMQAGAEDEFRKAKELAEVPQIPQNFGAVAGLAPAAPAPVILGKAMAMDAAGTAVAAADKLARGELQLEEKVSVGEAVAGRTAAGVEGALGGREFFAFVDADSAGRMRGLVRQFFRKIGPTKEWAENNYYKLPIAVQNAELIPINAFWRDFAAWDGKAPFLSKNIAEASRNFSEMILALAVLDLPFEAAKHTTKIADGQYTLTAAGPLIAFHKEIKSTLAGEAARAPSDLLISENFFRHGDRHRMEGNEKFDKYVTDEFLAGVVYGGNVVVTNPTSSPQKLELLTQIPKGALPVLGSKATDSKSLRLEPFTTQTFEYHFYFPTPAPQPQPHFPAHVARSEQTAGSAKAFAFNVVRQLSKIDTASWEHVSQYGSDSEVFAFLEQNNLGRIDLELVAWRARKSVDFFRKLIALLEKRHAWSEPVYRYAVLHNEPAPLREWLRHRDDFLAQCGPWLATKLLAIDPIERRAYEHLEYNPLINQRAHRLGGEPRIANPVLRGQYQALLRILAHKPQLDAIDAMSVVYYLFLQDRMEEALARFAAIRAEDLPTRLQHDYFRCYAALYESKAGEARVIAGPYAQHPVDRWRKLFAEVIAQLDEIEGKAAARKADDQPNREAEQGELAATEPSFDFKVENRTIALTWRNLGEVTINFYLMDPEFLFSSSPFVTQDPGRFSIIKPGKSLRQPLAAGESAMEIPLPAEFQRANVLVEILGAGQRKAQAYHANTLKLTLVENYGRLEVRDQAANKPVAKAYVKVYARLKNGAVRFYKDGYTDLRGKFDYASLNSSESPAPPVPMPRGGSADAMTHQMLAPQELGAVEKLAILVLSDTNGAAMREAAPPSE